LSNTIRYVSKNFETEDLLKSCLNYPFYLDILAGNSLQHGFDYVYKDFNGIRELLKRKDTGKILFDYYTEISCKSINSKSSIIDKGNFLLDFIKLEILLSQDQVLLELSYEKKTRIATAFLQ